MKLGARILKTGIAIVLALFLSHIFNLPSPVFAGIAAIFALQPTVYRSYQTIIEHVQGNLIGAATAVLFVMAFGNSIFIIGLAAVLVITLNLKLKLENTISLSLVTLIAIMETPGENFIQFALIRFSTIMLGVISAFIVNLVFLPPKYENKLFNKTSTLAEEITKWIRLSTRHASERELLRADIKRLSEGTFKLDQLYNMYKEERNYFKNNKLAKSRKLVIYRQMIITTRKALETLKRLHRYENEFNHMPLEFKEVIQYQLDCLVNHHEQVMLKFVGKIRPETPPHVEAEVCLNKNQLFELFLEQKKDFSDVNSQVFYHVMQLISIIMEYGEQVEHLDTLVTSFQSYHKDDPNVDIEQNIEI
ncbi:aromatic acid exporter family protein [Bacillus sp. REN3]|uniref:FUSC family protein n=1 Tax=Bacillus sp. REN3 TaxID=2802440 RepID=UPI001AEEBCCD|nr:aromatic acid exporter family protein [Bacillus sp. REN3]